MPAFTNAFLYFAVLLIHVQNQCCLNVQNKVCLSCPAGTHLYRGNCITNIDNCASYRDGFDCQRCMQGYLLINAGGECVSEGDAPLVADELEEIIDIKNPSREHRQAYLFSLNFALNSQAIPLQHAKPVGASIYALHNKSKRIKIQFSHNLKYHLVVLDLDPQQKLAHIASIRQISAPTLTLAEFLIQRIDVKNSKHLSIIKIIDEQIGILDQRIDQFVEGRILFNDDDTVDVVANYDGVEDGELWEVAASLDRNWKIQEISVDQIGYAVNPNTNNYAPLESPSQKTVQQMASLNSLTEDDIKSPEMQQIFNIITLAKVSQLTNSKYLFSFSRIQLMVHSYLIYFRSQDNTHIYEVKVLKDIIKKKIYITSLTQIL